LSPPETLAVTPTGITENVMREFSTAAALKGEIHSQRKQAAFALPVALVLLLPTLLVAAHALPVPYAETLIARLPVLGWFDSMLGVEKHGMAAIILGLVTVLTSGWGASSLERASFHAKRLKDLQRIAENESIVRDMRSRH
jgi:multisubunit Na+/H+ antiporter MnhG subunit